MVKNTGTTTLICQRRGLPPIMAILVVTIIAGSAFGHGGKTHADNEFTSLQALQKATELYDRLAANGKLDQTWETALVEVAIWTRKKGGTVEIVVSFKKSVGDPDKVYIFFTSEGKYAGSNFTGE